MVSDAQECRSRALIAASIIATDVKGRRNGAAPLCSLEEVDFLLELADAAYAPTDLDEAGSERLRALFTRARGSRYFTLRGAERMRSRLQAVEAALTGKASAI